MMRNNLAAAALLFSLLPTAAVGQSSDFLAFKPVDAEFSRGLDRIVMVAAVPGNQLHIYNPFTRTSVAVNLSAAPLALSLSPNGRFAAVGHANLITYVDLTAASVVRTYPAQVQVTDLVLTADYIYILPATSIRLSDGTETSPPPPVAAPVTRSRLGSDGAIYSQDVSQFSSPIVRREVAGAVISPSGGVQTTQPCVTAARTKPMAFPTGEVLDTCGSLWENAGLRYLNPLSGFYSNWALGRFGSISAAATGALLAVSGASLNDSNQPFRDDEIHLYTPETMHFRRGKFVLPGYGAAGRTHIRWLFFDSTFTVLLAIHQADASAALPNDFAVYSVTLPTPDSGCATTVAGSPFTAPAIGGTLSIPVTSSAYCFYGIGSPSAAWIAPLESIGAGPASALVTVRPNLSGSTRSGTLLIGSQTVTITQAALPALNLAAVQPLGYQILDAEYSAARERLIFTTGWPNELHIYDPASRADTVFSLPFPPVALTLTPDGLTAGVAGDGWAASIDLSTGIGLPLRTRFPGFLYIYPVARGDGYLYLFNMRPPSLNGTLTTLRLSNAAVQTQTVEILGRARPLPPDLRYVYVSRGTYPSGTGSGPPHKWDFGTPGAPQLLGVPGAYSSECLGDNFWFSENGARMTANCYGQVHGVSPTLASDLATLGAAFTLDSRIQIFTAADSAALKTLGLVPSNRFADDTLESEIRLLGHEGLASTGTVTLPPFSPSATVNSAGRYLFWNASADRMVVVVRSDSNPGSREWGVYVVTPGSSCAAPASGSSGPASFGREGGAGSVSVAGTCAWKATSNAEWLTITSGAFGGAGTGTLGYFIAANSGSSARTGQISFGNATYSVTQTGATVTLTPASASVAASGGTGSIGVSTSPAGASWTASSQAAWIQVTGGASGAGTGTVNYSVQANASTAARSGEIRVGGQVFTVNQAGAAVGSVQPSPAEFQVSAAGGSFTSTITGSGPWTAVANQSWIKITSPAGGSGNGNGTLAFTVDPNPTVLFRNGSITVNGVSISIYQAEPAGQATVSPQAVNIGAAGGSGTIQITANTPGYAWTSQGSDFWIVATASGTGSGTVTYRIQRNNSTSPRAGSILVAGQTVTVTQAGATPPAPLTVSGLHFVPVAPCRIADTRESTRPTGFGTPALAGGVPRSFAVPQLAACGIPAAAKAYALNVTVVPKGPLGYLTIWPTGSDQPFVSTLNAPDGRVKANAAIVPAGANGAVSVMATDATELVMDINGYFVDPALNAAALAYYPITPCRIADTRVTPNGALAGPIVGAGTTRSFPVRSAGCGIPANAQAYSLNATVVPTGPLGYITLWPTGQTQPFVSTLNAPTGAIVANAAIVPAGTGGEVSVFAQGQTHLVLDINGYFAPAGGAGAQRYYPVAPCRLVDTREGDFPSFSGERSFDVAVVNCGFPAAAKAYSLNATVVPTGVLGYLTLWPTGQPRPFVSTLNVTDDRVVANAAIVPAGAGGAVSAFATEVTHLVLDTNGYFAP